MQIAYPITDAVPSIEHTRDRFLAKLFDFRKNGPGKGLATDEDYELLYAYALVTGQIASEIDNVAALLEKLYGIMDEESLRLR
jgi:ATP-dependent RNA circularization protein (DNA/RNA ligase family)